MLQAEVRPRRAGACGDTPRSPVPSRRSIDHPPSSLRVLPVLLTLIAVGLACMLGWGLWQAYMAAPWTRDATVRAYVVTLAPQVSGRIVRLPVVDNQFVHKGEQVMEIDPTNYAIAVDEAAAAVEQARANAENAEREARRRLALTSLEVSVEEKQKYTTLARVADATYQKAIASLAQAKVNLERTNIRSPVNGYITNLLVQRGDYASVGDKDIAIVNSDSFWVDGYFEESNISAIHVGDPARIKLMGYSQVLHGHVQSIAHGIAVPNAEADGSGLATVNPIFTWVRLAQRIPVRIHIDTVPRNVHLAAGMTANVQIDPARHNVG